MATALSQILPLLAILGILGAIAFVLYQVYLTSERVQEAAAERMQKRNMSFSKDGGLRVQVRNVGSEQQVDRTQKYVVRAWNFSGKGINKND